MLVLAFKVGNCSEDNRANQEAIAQDNNPNPQDVTERACLCLGLHVVTSYKRLQQAGQAYWSGQRKRDKLHQRKHRRGHTALPWNLHAKSTQRDDVCTRIGGANAVAPESGGYVVTPRRVLCMGAWAQ